MYEPLNQPIITEITLVERFSRTRAETFAAESLPSHLLQISVSGRVEQLAGGVVERYGPGCAVWYYASEPVRGLITKVPWIFYSVAFDAPLLPPPPLARRVVRVTSGTTQRIKQLYRVWHDDTLPATEQQLRGFGLLNAIVADVLPAESLQQASDGDTAPWWRIESALHEDLSRPIDLPRLQRLGHMSQSSLFRASHAATGLPPMKRVKQMRMSYARGLVQFSTLPISEIAYRVGYERVQELSRDYRKAYGCAPSQDRA